MAFALGIKYSLHRIKQKKDLWMLETGADFWIWFWKTKIVRPHLPRSKRIDTQKKLYRARDWVKTKTSV